MSESSKKRRREPKELLYILSGRIFHISPVILINGKHTGKFKIKYNYLSILFHYFKNS
jgi:hypothetical protein